MNDVRISKKNMASVIYFSLITIVILARFVFPVDSHLKRYVSVVSDVQEFFGISSVFFVVSRNNRYLEGYTSLHSLSRDFSQKYDFTSIIYFDQLDEHIKWYRKPISRSLVVIFLRSMSDIAEFTGIFISQSYIWLMIFTNDSGNSALCKYCNFPKGNDFKLRFDTEMFVLCCDSLIVKEWWSVNGDQTEMSVFAAWTDENRDKLTLLVPAALDARRHDVKGAGIRIGVVKMLPASQMNEENAQHQREMAVKAKFSSFDELQAFRFEYEQATKQKFWIRSSHKTTSVNVKRSLSEKLVYYDLVYACIHGGLDFKARGKGERQTSTHKMDCPFFIKVLASSCGKFLEIKTVNPQHSNHPLSSKAFEHLPQNRKLAAPERAETEALLSLGCNKKKLQNKIARETSKHPTLKDLQNIASALKTKDENNLIKAVDMLTEQYGATVLVSRDEDNHFKGLFFTTEDMRASMTAWPEIILIDGTYKLLAQGFTLVLMVVVDSNGLTEVVGVCLTVHEDRETFEWFLNCFKAVNEEPCTRINCFMADKDLLARDILKTIFGVPVYVCLFHTLKTFSRQITPTRMGSSSAMTRDEILKLIQRLVYSLSDADYNEKYEDFCNKVPVDVLKYYDENWHSIREEWTDYNMVHGNLSIKTNNRLESMNHKIKQVVSKKSTLKSFIESFFEWLSSHKFERNNKAAQLVLKRPVTVFKPNSCEDLYMRYLTSYGFKYVLGSIHKSEAVNTTDITRDEKAVEGKFTVNTKRGVLNTTAMSCECGFFTSTLLPCKHIFAIRKILSLPLFDERICARRFTREFYLQNQRIFRPITDDQITTDCPAPAVTTFKPQKILTLSEKRKRASLIASSLVSHAVSSSNAEFLGKLQVLIDLEKLWRDGFDVILDKIEPRISGSSASSTSVYSDHACTSTQNSETQTLKIIPENFQMDNFDTSSIGSLNSELVNKVLDWETDMELDDITECLEKSSILHYTRTSDSKAIVSVNSRFNSDTALETFAGVQFPNVAEECNERHAKVEPVATSSFHENRGNSYDANLNDIIMPAPVRVRGRPKGSMLTVIGLKRSHAKKPEKIPVAFRNRTPEKQVRIILGWFIEENLLSDVLRYEYLIKESDVEVRPEGIDNAILDERIDLYQLKKYMDEDAFDTLINTVEAKRRTAIFKCNICVQELQEKSVTCSSCFSRYHLTCAGFKRAPRKIDWYCSTCLENK